ncbi:MAG: hypothetical protein Q8O89_02605 [Nanoarchaeota archaeon]|nr:hypothetical protein [Nanoarchaeota archaeon]
MIDITERVQGIVRKQWGSYVFLAPISPLPRNLLKYPTFVSPSIYEVHAAGEEISKFNIVLKNVMYQKREGCRKYEFQLSDGFSVIDAYKHKYFVRPHKHSSQLMPGDRIILGIGFFEKGRIGLYHYESQEPRGKKEEDKLSFLEKLILAPQDG